MTDNEYKNCPYCGEEIKVRAIKCKHCHSALDAGSPKEIESTNISDKLFISDKTSGMLINETSIYCRNCGSEVKEKAVICISCGVNPLNVSKGVNLNIDAQEMVYHETQKTLHHKDNTDSIAWNKGTYKGQIRDGKPHGEGTWYSSYDGAMLFGIWDNGNFVRSIRIGNDLKKNLDTQEQGMKENNYSENIYAGFWKRVGAYIIDSIILYIITSIGGFVYGATMFEVGITDITALGFSGFVLGIIIAWLYHAILESSSTQATVGKMALGIKVTDLRGNQIGFGKATGRYFGMFLSSLILGIGFFMVAFTEKKQGLHDILAGCLVINKKMY